MAAGQGFKDFTTGEVLTAADVDGYLMQGIWVFANATARDAAVTSPQEGNFAFTKDNNSLWYYDGAAWVASGATGDIEGVTAGTGISGGGTSGTVTITNSMATEITASGDIIVGTGSGTFDNLPIGTTGQVLTADTTVSPYKVKWAAPAGGSGLTLIQRSTFSNVANTGTTFDDVFTSTYKTYMLIIDSIYAATYSDDLQMQFRYAGPTTQTSGYSGNQLQLIASSSTITNANATSQSSALLAANISQSSEPGTGQFYVSSVGNSSLASVITGTYFSPVLGDIYITTYTSGTPRTYTGFLLKSSSTNITGTVAVYGLA